MHGVPCGMGLKNGVFLKNLFYQSTVDLQCYVNFRCKAKLIYLHMHTHIYTFFFIFFSIMVYYRILNIVPCAIQ